MKHLILLSGLVLLSAGFAIAQPKEKTKKEVIDFSKGGKTTTKEVGNGDAVEYQNAIWVEATSFLAGYVDMGYERAFTDHFSLEIAGGSSFNSLGSNISDGLGLSMFNAASEQNSSYWTDKGYMQDAGIHLNSISSTSLGNSSTLKPIGGIYLLLEPKYFPEDDVFDGFFVAGRFQYLTNNYTTPLPDIEKSNSTGGSLLYGTQKATITRANLDIIPSLGWEWQAGRVLFDLEGGLGVRFASITGYDTGSKSGGNGTTYEMLYPYTESAILPTFSAALKLGFNF